MAKINLGRVIAGGLLAGLVLNIGEYLLNEILLGQRWADAFKSLNLPPMDRTVAAYFTVLIFALGIITVWVYAAIRPRFGAGPMTAVCAGLTVWVLASAYATGGVMPMHLFPRRLLAYAMAFEFFLMPIAAVIGAWLYKEEGQPSAD
jgi:hypothetical protein